MWAILDKDNETVIGVLLSADDKEDDQVVVKMTVENSPAWIGAKYINGKFEGDK